MKYTFNQHALTSLTLHHFMGLQDKVLNALPDSERHFITPRAETVMADHLIKDMPVLGLYDGSELVAAVIISHPDVTQKYQAENPMIKGFCLSKIGIIEGLYVDASYRRQGLATHLVHAASKGALTRGRTHLSAEIAVENIASYNTFIRHGFAKVAEFICPDDGCHVMSVQGEAQSILAHKTRKLVA